MRLLCISIIILFLNSALFSQQIIESTTNSYLVKFIGKPEISVENFRDGLRIIDFIEAMDEAKSGYPKIPSKVFYLAIPPYSKAKVYLMEKFTRKLEGIKVTINPKPEMENDSILVYKEMNLTNEIKESEIYPEKEFDILGYTWIRDFYVVGIKINTHRYSIKNQTLEVIDSCLLKIDFDEPSEIQPSVNYSLSTYDEILREVIINFDDAIKFRGINSQISFSDTTGGWIDYTKEYLKLAIPNDNIYRITYNDLVSFGVNPNQINPKTIKLFSRGREIPIFVSGEEDNLFDTTDFIEFYAEKNYSYQDYRRIVSLGDDYIHYMNRYSDTSIVWLTWSGLNGKRVGKITDNITTTIDTVSSHLVKLHLERDAIFWYYDPTVPRVQLPFWQENKVHTWLSIGNSGSNSATFIAREFLSNTPVKVIARLISYASSGSINAHRHGLSLNRTTPQDTITYNYKQTVNFVGNYNSSQLIQGNNVIRVFGIPSQATFHQSFIDWFDVEYYRRNFAINDTLKIIIPDTVQRGLRTIRIENISNPNNIVVYKIYPNLKKVTNFNVVGANPATIFFVDTVSGGDQYYLTVLNKISKPLFKTKKFFGNLRSSSRGADYIIITNKILQSSANQYKNFIASNYNQRVELVFDEDIYDEFSFGMLSAEAIKSFLISAYRNWTPPKPSFLTIIGDANNDYKDVITPAPTPRKKNIVTSFGNPVSDVWYVMWDSVNIHFPQMFVGRIPANNDA
ncbi:MAG: C25 family cysteine peptidase, partial [Ignavibacterium sp.]|nr:C25 family cysteine peptidase [Ignavibacterium sp.]